MEVSQNLQVSAGEFFDALATSVAYDISQATGKKINGEQIHSGYRYTKKMKNKVKQEGNVQITIKQFTKPVSYEAVFKSAQDTNFISYQIEDLKDGSIQVRYKEGFQSDSSMKSLNHKVTSAFYSHIAKRRILKMLKSMEQYIKNKKGNG